MIVSAADLWTTWVESGTLRPQDYDADIERLVRDAAGPSEDASALTDALNRLQWDARDLLHALLPVLTSFSGMLADLLALYERVGATRANKANLRIKYEFEDGQKIDEDLASFREHVRRVRRVMARLTVFRLPSTAWKSPFSRRARELNFDEYEMGSRVLGTEGRTWQFSTDFPSPVVDDPVLSRILGRHRLMIVSAIHCWADLNVHTRADWDKGADLDELYLSFCRAASDGWVVGQIGLLNLAPVLVDRVPDKASDLLQAQDDWLAEFWEPGEATEIPITELVDEVTDVLSLPYWGRRHELYSAWITAAMDAALDHRLIFDVTDGVLAFPFRATLLARMTTSMGRVELWTEKRFDALQHNLHGKRKNHIQPDYVFIDPAQPNDPLVVVEAKQYLSSNSRNPGDAAHDYSQNLPHAQVLVVAHGPLGPTTMDRVEAANRTRVSLYPDVRPGSTAAVHRFGAELAALLPDSSLSDWHAASSLGSQSVQPSNGTADDSVPLVDPQRAPLGRRPVFLGIEYLETNRFPGQRWRSEAWRATNGLCVVIVTDNGGTSVNNATSALKEAVESRWLSEGPEIMIIDDWLDTNSPRFCVHGAPHLGVDLDALDRQGIVLPR